MSETYNPTIPIEVGSTSPRMHITAERALELPCKRKSCRCCGSGNGWFREERHSVFGGCPSGWLEGLRRAWPPGLVPLDPEY